MPLLKLVFIETENLPLHPSFHNDFTDIKHSRSKGLWWLSYGARANSLMGGKVPLQNLLHRTNRRPQKDHFSADQTSHGR